MKTIRELYDYRTMISSLIKRELRGRYKGSVLGFAWTFINPLLQLLVYTLVFSTIMRAGIEDYYLFLFVALMPWIFFANSVAGGTSCITGQKEMVSKIYFPREVLPLSYVTYELVNFLLTLLVVIAVVIVSGKGLNPLALLCLPVVIIAEYLLALGLTFITSSVMVYFRDMANIMGIITMAWQFLTPVMYSVDMVPEELRGIFYLNPMTPIIIAYRDILYFGQVPELRNLLHGFFLSLALIVIGWFTFGKLKKHFAEEL
ncbi:MAG: ABC transporter permease [Lachnospiraceae bacterium]|nr:ABC transporter permease [Lachnospiraceae bacterium]